MKQKIAVVVQRCGDEVIGGAESHAFLLSQRLANSGRYLVDVLTTNAKDYRTWSPYYLPTSVYKNGINLKRFPVAFSRHPKLFSAYNFFFSVS